MGILKVAQEPKHSNKAKPKEKIERKRKKGYFAGINIGESSTPTAIGEAELSNGRSKKNKLRSGRSYHVGCHSIERKHPKRGKEKEETEEETPILLPLTRRKLRRRLREREKTDQIENEI